MACRNCGTTDDLYIIGVIDLSDEDADMFDIVMCLDCLMGKSLYCEHHDEPKMLVYNPDMQESESGGELALASACLECCVSEAEGLSDKALSLYRELLKGTCPEAFLDGLEMVGQSLLDRQLERPVAFALVVASKLFCVTLDEAVTQFAAGPIGSASLH